MNSNGRGLGECQQSRTSPTVERPRVSVMASTHSKHSCDCLVLAVSTRLVRLCRDLCEIRYYRRANTNPSSIAGRVFRPGSELVEIECLDY